MEIITNYYELQSLCLPLFMGDTRTEQRVKFRTQPLNPVRVIRPQITGCRKGIRGLSSSDIPEPIEQAACGTVTPLAAPLSSTGRVRLHYRLG
jgi:hypothetical protein